MIDFSGMLDTLWGFLDTNFGSALVGAIVFGVIAGVILNLFIGRRERRSLSRQVQLILKDALKENIETQDLLIDQLNKEQVSMVPDPFNVIPLQVILRGKFVEVMKPELVSKIANAYRYCSMINIYYSRLSSTYIGPARALTGVSNLRQSLILECQNQLVGLKKYHLEAQELLNK